MGVASTVDTSGQLHCTVNCSPLGSDATLSADICHPSSRPISHLRQIKNVRSTPGVGGLKVCPHLSSCFHFSLQPPVHLSAASFTWISIESKHLVSSSVHQACSANVARLPGPAGERHLVRAATTYQVELLQPCSLHLGGVREMKTHLTHT